jgi:UDP-GlcNAc:undecaprenyl-phosphate/decaprenyl-phosphate GlcNAc-1-phosphate transferase
LVFPPGENWRMPLNADWIVLTITCALSLGLTPLFRKIALRTQFLDSPLGQLKKHTAPIPYLGGLAIYFSFLMGILGVLIAAPPPDSSRILAIFLGGTVVVILGLADDLFSLSPAVKFFFEILAACLLVGFGVQLEFIPGHPLLEKILTVFWVVAVTNAINLIDIMDGLAGGVAVIACMGLVFVPFLGAQSYVHLTAAALAGCVLGFLPFNYQPARIYMGDSGALFLGFVLAGLAMGHGYSHVNLVALCAPLFILGLPLYDTALVMFLRTLKGRSMFRGSNDHLALRLRSLGLTVRQTVHLLWLLSILLVLGAAFLVRTSEKRALAFLILFFLSALLFTAAVAGIPVEEGRERIRENPFRMPSVPKPPSAPSRKKGKRK